MPLGKDLREFVECLNSNKVEYLILGALAVSWHGFDSGTSDPAWTSRTASIYDLHRRSYV
jgi:hypothetical protein